jgi:hypothetical protein
VIRAAPRDTGLTRARRTSSRWWYAASKQVGPAPTLTPGVLGQSAVLLVLATVGGPLGPAGR